MAIQQIQQSSVEATVSPQYFPVYGPAPRPNPGRRAFRQIFYRQPGMALLLIGFAGYCLYSLWAAQGYWGGEAIYHWRCETLAGLLVGLTVFLFRQFRQWEQEGAQRVARRREYEQELAALLQQTGTAPPREVMLEIAAWKSERTARLIEPDGSITELPDADLAPDMLVLQIQVPQTSRLRCASSHTNNRTSVSPALLQR